MKILINKFNSWLEGPEPQEAERFEDWFHRLNPKKEIPVEVFNQFHTNLRETIKKSYSNTKNNKKS